MQNSFGRGRADFSYQHHTKLEDLSDDPMVLAGMSSESYPANGHDNEGYDLNSREGSSSGGGVSKKSMPANGKKTKGRVKIKMEFIDNKLRRYTTFSKRKTGIMKKAYELSTLTGTQVMLLVASETGHVYTFATRKLQPMITSEAGKALIQTCLNSPDLPQGSSLADQRMSATGFEETDLTYSVADDCEKMSDSPENVVYESELSPGSLRVSTAATLLPPSLFSRPTSSSKSSTVTSTSGGFTPILPAPPAGGGTKSKSGPSSDSSSSHKSISVVPNSSSNLSVVSGSVVLPQSYLQRNNVFYHTGQGLMYAAPANISEGVVVNLSQEQGGSQQQFITLPVSLTLTSPQQQLVQAQVATPSTTFTSSSTGHTHKKARK